MAQGDKTTFELQAIEPDKDFQALARCLFESHENPPQRFFHLWFPIHGLNEQAREDAIEEAASRLKLWHTNDPSSQWIKVVDTQNGQIAGASLWNIYTENAFLKPDDLEVTWFPDGGSRRFVEQAIDDYNAPRAQCAQKAHIYLFVIYTLPSYRRKGLGQKMMDWGISKAGELGYEIYLDSTPYGKSLYEANGFKIIKEKLICPKSKHPDAEWQRMEEKVGAFTFWPMYRPANL